MLRIDTKKRIPKLDGYECKIMNKYREDGLIEVFIPVLNQNVVVESNEIDSDE